MSKFKVLCIFYSMLLTGCVKQVHPNDPFEPVNRVVYSFNKAFDTVFTGPVVSVYNYVTPKPWRIMLGNFMYNLGEIPTIANDILQLNFNQAANDIYRFGINSTVGMFGLFDIAKEYGFAPHTEDFGQTLSYWGYKNSSYLVLPILGPSTIRDTIGLSAYYYVSIPRYLPSNWRNPYWITSYIDKKSELSKARKILDAVAATDEYTVVRNGFLQHREFLNNNSMHAEDSDDLLGEPPI